MWRPISYAETGDSSLRVNSTGKVMCPNCEAWRPPACVVDCQGLPIPEDWACDCCWTKWERMGRVVDGGLPITGLIEYEWRRRWVVAHGAPLTIVRKFGG